MLAKLSRADTKQQKHSRSAKHAFENDLITQYPDLKESRPRSQNIGNSIWLSLPKRVTPRARGFHAKSKRVQGVVPFSNWRGLCIISTSFMCYLFTTLYPWKVFNIVFTRKFTSHLMHQFIPSSTRWGKTDQPTISMPSPYQLCHA